MPNAGRHLLLDVGGTWIKGIAIDANAFKLIRQPNCRSNFPAFFEGVKRVPSVAPGDTEGFLAALRTLTEKCGPRTSYKSVVISTAGIVSPCGSRVGKCSPHLSFLLNASWRNDFEAFLGCPVTLINDGEAFMLGAAELGYVPRLGTVCALILGTGLGCALVRDGRWWRPQGTQPLPACLRVPGGNYDSWVSASKLAAHDPGGDLLRCLSDPEYKAVRDAYWAGLAQVVISTSSLYGADKLLLGGGLCTAAALAKIDIKAEISKHFVELPPELNHWPELEVVSEGNMTQLIGAAALATGHVERTVDDAAPTDTGTVDQPARSSGLQCGSYQDVLNRLWKTGEIAGNPVEDSWPVIAQVIGHVVQRWPAGGRIIYVGTGHDGRRVALDSLEILRRFGESRDRVVCVLAEGIGETFFDNQSDHQARDYSAVSDMILLNPGPNDTVIGISPNGPAFFVRSALTYARQQGAATAMIQTGSAAARDIWNWKIPLPNNNGALGESPLVDSGAIIPRIIHLLTTTVLLQKGKLPGC